MKVAIIHYWLVSMRGGEAVLEELCRMYPEADVYTNVLDRSAISEVIREHDIHTTFIQKLPIAVKLYKAYLPLMPLALEQLDLTDYDLVISSESGPAKNVITAPHAVHVCYCHTPMRYIWDMRSNYSSHLGTAIRMAAAPVAHYVRICDALSAARVDRFIANSTFVAQRIKRYYGQESIVVPPPVNTNIDYLEREQEDFYLALGQLVRYKRFDLAIEAFNRMNKRLVVIGAGEEMTRLQKIAGPTISLLGWQPKEAISDLLARSRGLIFPGMEDFGIVPVEAMAAGKPVIAYGKGGVCDTIIDGVTGVLFHEQTSDSLVAAVKWFERNSHAFSRKTIMEQSSHFARANFRERMKAVIEETMDRTAQIRLSSRPHYLPAVAKQI
ncbi:glycosyl transferase [Skermanella stibiiresistens SB22]|uniref:Glycosyl transferase n=1 Tax=Skermanella stibiiresistens SB22 TaxID=1385369 RepID=W9GTI7_9PROT|nr:glycosyltransferase [Skermanella stibiiresistens]EWY37094.1 glycosyl transferase [Skermanella stibiiresistens SB22]